MGLTELISAALPKATAGQNDEPLQIHAGGSNGQTAVPQIPLSTPHHLQPVLVGRIASNPVGTRGKKAATDGTNTPSTRPFITMVEVQALLAQQKASEASRKEPAVTDASASSVGQFITLAEVQALLTKEKAKTVLPSLPSSDIRPHYCYPITILSLPYLEGYAPPKFVKFDRKEGSAQEHMVHFIDSLEAHASVCNMRLHEFSKSLTSSAYTWYVNLEPYSINTWEEMVNSFYTKFLQVREKVTVISLKEIQQSGEDMVDYFK